LDTGSLHVTSTKPTTEKIEVLQTHFTVTGKEIHNMEILLASDVMSRLKISLPTLYRWTAEAKAGIGTFPQPISEPGKQLRWNADDIENWVGCRNQQSTPKVESATQRSKRNAVAVKRLQAKGVNINTSNRKELES
jgi:predicted DNA-binding transcriptional regulator AlpA